MAILTDQQVRGYDNDWYCVINGLPIHIASMGGNIPINFRDTNVLRDIQRTVGQLQYQETLIHVNEDFIKTETSVGYEYLDELDMEQFIFRLNENAPSFNYNPDWPLKYKLYAYSFIDKARKGFYSYARSESDNKYHLVARPENPIDFNGANLNLQRYEVEEDGFPEILVITD